MSTTPAQYYQCKLSMVRMPARQTVGWIEASAAKVGLKVELLPDKEWWEVMEVNTSTPQSITKLKDREKINRRGLPSTRDTRKDERKRIVTPTQEAADAVAKRINDQSNAREMARQSQRRDDTHDS